MTPKYINFHLLVKRNISKRGKEGENGKRKIERRKKRRGPQSMREKPKVRD